MPQIQHHKAGPEDPRQDEPVQSNLTPAARALITKELGEDWLKTHFISTDEMTEDEAATAELLA